MSRFFPVKKIPIKKWEADFIAGSSNEHIILRCSVVSKIYRLPGNFLDTGARMHFAMSDLIE